MNERGETGQPGAWSMLRQVNSAVAENRCFLRLYTTTLESSGGVTPAASYGIDWAQVTEVDYFENFVLFKAAHMAEDEYGALIVPSAELAEMLWAVFDFMIELC